VPAAYAVRKPVQNVYLVRERDRKRTRELLALALAALPPMLVLFAAIWANLETVRLGYQLERLESQREVLFRRRRNLVAERAAASALTRVEAIAKEKLELGPPRLPQVIVVADGALASGVAAPPPRPTTPPVSDLPEMYGPPAPISTEEGF
jgi:cell division protein FtsL